MKAIRFEIHESDEIARREVTKEIAWQPSRDIPILAEDSRVDVCPLGRAK